MYQLHSVPVTFSSLQLWQIFPTVFISHGAKHTGPVVWISLDEIILLVN